MIVKKYLAGVVGHLPEQEVLDLYVTHKNNTDLTMQGRIECFMDYVEVCMPAFFKKLKSN